MKKTFLFLSLIGLFTLSTTSFAQQSTTSQPATKLVAAQKTTAQSSTGVTEQKKVISRKITPSKTTASRTTTAATVIDQPKSIGLEQKLATFIFVINRGEVFSINAPGELTELSLSGFVTDALSAGSKAMMNETVSNNTVSLSGAVMINPYSPEPATGVTASISLRPLTASKGLTLSLTVDGQPLRVLLPFDSGDCRWVAGYTYRYVVTVSGGALQVTGMSVSKTV